VLIAHEDKRTENLMRLSFIWGRSGTFSETPEDFACVTEDLRREFAISEDAIRDAMKQSELLNEAWREAAIVSATRERASSSGPMRGYSLWPADPAAKLGSVRRR